jgi:hypothetical protein
MIFVGYSDTSKAYRLWDLGTNKVKESNDVTFNETVGKFLEPTLANEVTDWTVVVSCEASPKPLGTITRTMTRMQLSVGASWNIIPDSITNENIAQDLVGTGRQPLGDITNSIQVSQGNIDRSIEKSQDDEDNSTRAAGNKLLVGNRDSGDNLINSNYNDDSNNDSITSTDSVPINPRFRSLDDIYSSFM